jgi:hypothetical protein
MSAVKRSLGPTPSYLDAQRIRQLSLRSLRAYAFDLLHFARWWRQDPSRPLSEIAESTLLDMSAINSTNSPSLRLKL